MPRSGTSLVMQMLEAGGLPLLVDAARPPDAGNPRGYYEYAPVKATARDASWLARAEGRAVKVIHHLLPHLPPGPALRVISLHRDMREVLASQRVLLGEPAEPSDPAAEARLGEVMRAQLEDAEAGVRARPGAGLLVVEHAALLRDPAGQAERIARFLGGAGRDLDVAAMAACVAPALHRQREGAGLKV